MRLSLAVIFLWFGAMKFTSYEATLIAPLIMNSPLLAWLHGLSGIQGASNVIGVLEVVAGASLLAGFASPRLAAAGGAMAVVTFIVTLSFLFSTPGVGEPLAGGFPALSAVPGQFLLKDLGLLGIALFVLGDSIVHAGRGVSSREDLGARIRLTGGAVLRYGLALIFLWFGAMKFTSYEATGIAGFIANSPLLAWLHVRFGIQGASVTIGVIELATGAFLLLGGLSSRLQIVGAAMAVLTFALTVTFLFTTPGVAAPAGFPLLSGDVGQFLLKDVGLLAVSLAMLREALARRSVLVAPVSKKWAPSPA